jgi:hypothetical protein
MQSSPALQAANRFLGLVWEGDTPSDEALLAALDGLVASYHLTPEGDVSDPNVDAPRQEHTSVLAEVAARFPNYGFYPVADPTKTMDDALMMADAIDDLADLTRDMREVVWLAEHLGIDDAHWTFRLMFSHWGQHARELSLYLCGRIYG